ncbi:hypothetical protein LOK49_LG10G01160 [Camellia lanceoleosa]|uniref:Uncharacterized protein n=1 Tax=Camellia lanceoleosa TaxID=1840588 RepID=A0ACC0GE99_9ERIC|nr:hypothetical protein LOK49_LG10G01160 [Camellia lanceoleosa]
MASGSSGRNNSASKGFDFATTDDIVCSYEDYDNQDNYNGRHSDSVIGSNSAKCKFAFLPRLARFPQPKMGKSPI